MKSMKLMALGGAMAMLAACQTNLEMFESRGAPTGGTAFTQALAGEYRTFSAGEWRARGSFGVSEYYAAKGMRAHAGEAVPPEEIGTWGPWFQVADELARERARLVAVLPGARTSNPRDAAIAQRAFDCWLTRASTVVYGEAPWAVNPPSAHLLQMTGQASSAPFVSCKDEFLAAMARLGAPTETGFVVLFDTNRFNIRPDQRPVIDRAIAAVRASGSRNVVVEGHADTVGRPGPNLVLSERRANEVRRVLLAGGVQAQISTQGFGETRLAVPTADNTNEQRNRRAVIVIR